MTRDEAIVILECARPYSSMGCGASDEEIEEAMTMAIRALKQELKQEPCDDCISRQAVKDMLIVEWTKYMPMELDMNLSFVLDKISVLPSVTPKASEQQPSREWKEIYAESEGSNSWIEFKCPHCGYSFGMESGEYDWYYGDEIPWKYCPICGGSAEHKPYKAESEV